MAKFNTSGIEDIEKMFTQRDIATSKAIPAMVQAGGEVLVRAQKAEAEAMFRGNRSTGDLAGSIKATKVQGNDEEKYVEVYPHGKDRHGVSNATKGFVQQYGRSNMPARPWMSAANEKATDDVQAAMRAAWEAEQNG